MLLICSWCSVARLIACTMTTHGSTKYPSVVRSCVFTRLRVGTPKSSAERVREASRRPTRGTAPSGDGAHPATLGQRSALGEERLVEESPSGDTEELPPCEPSDFR